MIIATWNLNNRVGKVGFRPEAAKAAIAVGAELFVFTEFYPQKNEESFRAELEQAGLRYQMISPESTEKANRILIVSQIPLFPINFSIPSFDQQFQSNLLGVILPSIGLVILGMRIPAYKGNASPLLLKAWQWLETTADDLKGRPAVILGDLNISTTSIVKPAYRSFHRILSDGWYRAEPPERATYFSKTGYTSEIDHIMATNHCAISNSKVIKQIPGFSIAGGPGAISDHAILLCDVEVKTEDLATE